MNQDCLFCDIFNRKKPASIVYEDENTMGFIDAIPRLAKGQCVVIHKRHVEQFYELEDNEVADLFLAVKRVSVKLKKVFGPKYVCVFSRGQTVPHAHIIVYPSEPLCTMDGVIRSLDTMRRLAHDTTEAELEKNAKMIADA